MLNTMVLTKDGKKYNLTTQQVGFFLGSNKVSQIMLVTDKGVFVLDAKTVKKINIKKANCISQWCNDKWTSIERSVEQWKRIKILN